MTNFIRRLALAVLFVLPAAAQAECTGTNLIAALPPAEQTALRAAARSVPYPDGNFWRASRGTQTVHLIGTYHLDDPRHAATMTRLASVIAETATLLVEAGPAEEAALAERVAREPGVMMITDGPTIPELLSEPDWQALSTAMRDRGIPPFMVAKMRPWYLSMLLGIPACDMEKIAEHGGLDALIMAAAKQRGIPVKALEPYDTVFGLFDDMPEADQLAMVRTSLQLEPEAEDMSVTLADTYFAEESRLIWDFMRFSLDALPGADPARTKADMALMEIALMTTRNQNWIPVIEAYAAKGPLLVAFGALHLSGDDGVLTLLAARGFELERLPF